MGIIEELGLEIKNVVQRKNRVVDFFNKYGHKNIAKEIDELYSNKSDLFELNVKKLRDLKMAVIMDQFTLESYRPECNILELTPDNWQKEIKEFQPDLVFIESAWQGKDKLWYRKVDRSSKEIMELTSYCHDENIPVVFWNKEDPVYTSSFMTTAALADYVFTTDIDCIKRYKTELGHDRVYHLHFAAQPLVHNPIDKYDRKDKFCFAGAYYHKYPKRAEVFDKFAKVFLETKGFDIYDRNYKNALPEHAFPEIYNPYILGNLKPSEIDVAYKGYNYGINMNSVQQSQTMFARRVFEMLASNTVTIGNYSRGIKNYFGDLTICTDDSKTLDMELRRYCMDEDAIHKYRLLGLRKVLSEHIYEDRLSYIVEKVFGKKLKRPMPRIAMVAHCKNQQQYEYAMSIYEKQNYTNKKIIIIGNFAKSERNDVLVYTESEAAKAICDIKGVDYYACVSMNDYYGKNYILDMALTVRYGEYEGIGKATHYTYKNENIIIANAGSVYRTVDSLIGKLAIIHSTLAKKCTLLQMSDTEKKWTSNKLFAVDEFNYCENYVGECCDKVDDINVVDQGISLSEIENIAETIVGDEIDEADKLVVKGKDLFEDLAESKKVHLSKSEDALVVTSELDEGVHEYLFTKKMYEIASYVENNKMSVKFQVNGDLDFICAVVFFDNNGQKIEPQYPRGNVQVELNVPQNATTMKIGFRAKGQGKEIISNVVISKVGLNDGDCGCFLTKNNVLVLTNQYPAPEALYRNMFVHKRVIGYREAGRTCDVMRMHVNAEECFREFEGISVIEGQTQKLISLLDSGRIDTVCVHFLDKMMWNVLREYTSSIKLIVWLHGADVQPWWRRTYNYENETEENRAKEASKEREALWYEVFEMAPQIDITFVFVSNYFMNEVNEDYNNKLPKDKCRVIHNFVDTELFEYAKKDVELRKNIVTIKPFVGRKYGNDLTTNAILLLSKEKFFNELEINIYGNGEKFELENKPLEKFKNVHLHQTFLTQEEIKAVHQNNGIYIATTRWDSQGVSRDEAMSSGLVVIANNVSAIPEFVDEESGVLVPEENYTDIVEAIKLLYNDEKMFEKLSENAAKRVRSQTAKEFTISKEVDLIFG